MLSAQCKEALAEYPMPRLQLAEPHVFHKYVRFLHNIIVCSEDLLREAVSFARGDYHDYLLTHLIQERGHAEWLRNDMVILRIEPNIVDHRAASIAGAQYYYIRHVAPQLLLGYMAVLESRPMTQEDVAALTEVHGSAGMRTIAHHAQHDPKHAEELWRQIDKLDERWHAPLLHNVAHTAQLCSACLGAL
jgi:hypothetical protein